MKRNKRFHQDMVVSRNRLKDADPGTRKDYAKIRQKFFVKEADGVDNWRPAPKPRPKGK